MMEVIDLSLSIAFYHWDKKNDQLNARDIFRKNTAPHSAFNSKAKHHEVRQRVGAVGVLFFLYQGYGSEKYSIRTTDGTLLGLEFHSSGLVATLNLVMHGDRRYKPRAILNSSKRDGR